MTAPFASHGHASSYRTAPENRPTALSALLPDVTPTGEHYRRNHFAYPLIDRDAWRLRITGAVAAPVDATVDDLRQMPAHSHRVLLECAGHRRTEFQPPISGVQWGLGALSQAVWSGVALADVLALAGVRHDAVEVVLHGADRGPFADVPGVHTFSRSLPIGKASHPDTLLALDMNGVSLPREHGAPLRAIVPGWYAMDSVKWLTGIEVATQPFRGPFQELDYRFRPAGDPGIGARLDVMPPHALFVSVADGGTLPAGYNEITGIAWAGKGIASVEIRVGAGEWEPAKIVGGRHRYERAVWRAVVDLPPGQRSALAVRAFDRTGRTQGPAPVWNARGYANNSVQRIEVNAGRAG